MTFKNFIKRFQFEYLYNALRETFLRFPLSVTCAVAQAGMWVLSAHDVKLFGDNMADRLRLFFAFGLTLCTAVTLFIEGTPAARNYKWPLLGAGLALVAGLCFLPAYFTAAHSFFGAALALAMIFAPYIARSSSEDSIWYFNYRNGIGLVVAGICTLTLCSGLSAIVGSLNYLFPVLDVQGSIFGDIWSFGAFFFGPIAFMYQVPRQFDFGRDECVIPKGVFFLANYLAVPLVLIYTFILYVYFAKIVALWELPKGNLAYMVTGFGSLGIAARLAVFPMRQNGTVLLQQFYKYFFYLLFVPLVLLSIGIYTRISQYGLTEDRYAIALCLVWLSGLSAWHLLRPSSAHIKHVPIALSVLFVLASFGPWGAVPLSNASQVARLHMLLARAHLLVDGHVVKAEKDVSFDDRKEISATLEYIYSKRKESEIDDLVAPFKKKIEEDRNAATMADLDCDRFMGCYWGAERAMRLMRVWGMDYVYPYATEDNYNYVELRAPYADWNNDTMTKVSPYDYIVRFYAYGATKTGLWSTERIYKKDDKQPLKFKFAMSEQGDFTVTLKTGEVEGQQLHFALMPVLEKFHAQHVTDIKEGQEDEVTLHAESGSFKAEIRLSDLRARMVSGKLVMDSAQLTVLVSP